MRLSKDNLDKLKEKTCHISACFNCGNKEGMIIDEKEYHLISKDKVGLALSNISNSCPFIPLSVITCPKCGFVRLFNLKTLDIVKTDY